MFAFLTHLRTWIVVIFLIEGSECYHLIRMALMVITMALVVKVNKLFIIQNLFVPADIKVRWHRTLPL